jgi:F-type H+-transporting ATPase subunit b
MNKLILLMHLPLGEGFGFNGNILETNIINLAVVIGVVVTFVGDAIRSLLENRRQLIVNTLQQAEQRAQEAQAKLGEARAQLELAQKKAASIRQQGQANAEQEQRNFQKQTQDDTTRLYELKDESIRLQQQKAVSQVSQKVISLALAKVREKLTQRLDATFHESVNNFNVVLFTNYTPR